MPDHVRHARLAGIRESAAATNQAKLKKTELATHLHTLEQLREEFGELLGQLGRGEVRVHSWKVSKAPLETELTRLILEIAAKPVDVKHRLDTISQVVDLLGSTVSIHPNEFRRLRERVATTVLIPALDKMVPHKDSSSEVSRCDSLKFRIEQQLRPT